MGISSGNRGGGCFPSCLVRFLCVGIMREVEVGGSRVGIRIVMARRPKRGGTKASGGEIRGASE